MTKAGLLLALLAGIVPATAEAQDETASKQKHGKIGIKSTWAALYHAYAKAWNTQDDQVQAAYQRNRYDLVLFGKKYKKIAGHEVKVSDVPGSSPTMHWSGKILKNKIKGNGLYAQTFPLIAMTKQVWLGPVPILFKVSSAFTLAAAFDVEAGDQLDVKADGGGVLALQAAAAAGFKFGYVGIEVDISIIEGHIWVIAKADESALTVQCGVDFQSSGAVYLTGKIGPFQKKFPLWYPPPWKWYDKTLLDVTLD